ncbi:hypothetical protein [Sinomonas humi]|uniref:Alkylmercury lyase n=1 Tax=Sinomonas humi TaxID=1338436 RepID=A0A0B2AMJ9_9MICC|nr:hypothetical protein [Sinomonas humi]KHL02950.1 hypothetical protein LK10_11225 [Sinomonas humi]
MRFPPTIHVLYIEDCPNWEGALRLARDAAWSAGAAEVDVLATEVSTPQQAAQLGFAGSPTILVAGRDPFPGVRSPALKCRVFQTSGGPSGLPDRGQLVQAIRTAIAA